MNKTGFGVIGALEKRSQGRKWYNSGWLRQWTRCETEIRCIEEH